MPHNQFHFHKNNLHTSISPYLQQHSDNPVWWQEFSDNILEYARQTNKPVLLSSGYSTCHWCHVMAADAFSDMPTADFLNTHFVCIKIDREMRPDIDAWMMSYIQKESGQGGWPLNVYVNYEMKPFFAMMYAPSKAGIHGQYSMLTILEHVLQTFRNNQLNFSEWKMKDAHQMQTTSTKQSISDEELISQMSKYFDMEDGGLYGRQKFPPHSALHYLLTVNQNDDINLFVRMTMLLMYISGLHDHLQGGFYRYCVDSKWTIPHFEKMLYDQSMMLINYSLAAHKFQAEGYKDIVKQLIICIENTFKTGNMYASAHDADTNHEEGLTYLWTIEELQHILTEEEFRSFQTSYKLIPFENKYHLIRNDGEQAGEIERKLLLARNAKQQPFKDEKIITSWNALLGIGYIFAYRYAKTDTLHKAKDLFDSIIEKHRLPNGLIAHTSFHSHLQSETFLEDMASVLLLATYLFEHDLLEKQLLDNLYQQTKQFQKEGIWYESLDTVLGDIPAETHDHPYPSSVSMAEAGTARYCILTDKNTAELDYKHVVTYDYYNLAVKWSRYDFPLITSPHYIDAALLPAGAIQKRGNAYTICKHFSCEEITLKEIEQGKLI